MLKVTTRHRRFAVGIYNEDRMMTRINKWSGGRVTVACGACLAIGLALGSLFL